MPRIAKLQTRIHAKLPLLVIDEHEIRAPDPVEMAVDCRRNVFAVIGILHALLFREHEKGPGTPFEIGPERRNGRLHKAVVETVYALFLRLAPADNDRALHIAGIARPFENDKRMSRPKLNAWISVRALPPRAAGALRKPHLRCREHR